MSAQATVCDCGGFAHPVASVHMLSCEKLRTKVNLSRWLRESDIVELRRMGVQADAVLHADDNGSTPEQYWYGRCGLELLLRASGLWWNGALPYAHVATPLAFLQLANKTLGSFREDDGLPERLDFLAATFNTDVGADTVERQQRRAAEELRAVLRDYSDAWHTVRMLNDLCEWCANQRFFKDCKYMEVTWTP